MGKKFLQTRASRKRVVVFAMTAIAIVIFYAIATVAFSEPFGVDGSTPQPSNFWVAGAQLAIVFIVGIPLMLLVVFICAAIIILIAFAIVAIAFGPLVFLFLKPSRSIPTLRHMSPAYDRFIMKIVNDIAPVLIGKILWPAKKVRDYINAGS